MTARQQARVAIPKRFTLPMRELVALQPRFERRDGRRALRLLDHPRFRAAYDFLLSACRGRRDRSGARAVVDGHSDRASPTSGSRAVEQAAPPSPAPRRRHRRRRRRRRRPQRERRRVVSARALDAGVRRDSAAISTIRRADRSAHSSDSRLLDGCRLVARSRLYRTAPLGPQDQPEFVNAAAGLLTQLAPRELLRALKRIEVELGRAQPVVRWGPRRIDLDLLRARRRADRRSRT